MAKPRKNYSYSKRPLWQWILIYIVIGGIIYGLLYYSGIIKLGNNYSSEQNFNSSDYNYIE